MIKDEEILDLIPQRAPIIMVDTFYGVEDNRSYSGLTVKADNIFIYKGYLNESGIIEHMAQSAAARVGYVCKQKNEPVPIGFIGSVDKLIFYSLPKVGDKLMTEVTIVQEVFDITLVNIETKVNDEKIAECKMKIFLQRD
jgi:predicted hotdog family 3-hydroxylacyl-ACP dehydratase